jgi:hypothetical protein
MAFVLFLDKTVNKITKVPASGYREEARLQEMIKDHPEVLSIPYSERLVSLTKEYSVAPNIKKLVEKLAEIYRKSLET